MISCCPIVNCIVGPFAYLWSNPQWEILLILRGVLISCTELGADTCLRFSVVVRPKVSFIMNEYRVSARIPSSARGQSVLARPPERDPERSRERLQRMKDWHHRHNFLGGTGWPQAELQVVFSGEWCPWMGIKKGSWEDNYVQACESFMASDPLPNSHSTE